MKRLAFTLAIVVSFLAFSSFSDDDSVAPAALKSFKTSFNSAKEVNWQVTEKFYKANFSLNGQYVSAYYDTEGKMIALTHNISSLQLPIALQASLKKNYEAYWISDLFEMANEDGTTYYITLENADSKLVLKSGSAEWSLFKKQRKS
jgi:mRNA deadenylase 3'-5' endonuclease subunit Ccr4